MFNWALRLRDQNEYLSPKGPSFASAPWKNIYLNETHIKIKVPRHRTKLPAEQSDTNGAKQIDDLERGYYESNGINYRGSAVITRRWDFYGPWFSGKLGHISLYGVIFSPEEPPEGLNYFHPRALEAGVADVLTVYYAHHFSKVEPRQMWMGPMEWQQRKDLPCVAARFNACRSKLSTDGPNCYLVFPLTKHHLLVLECVISRNIVFSDQKPEPTIDEWIDLGPLLKLANQVLDSVEITLSPQARADQEEALRGLTEEEKLLVKDYPPIKWPAPPIPDNYDWGDSGKSLLPN